LGKTQETTAKTATTAKQITLTLQVKNVSNVNLRHKRKRFLLSAAVFALIASCIALALSTVSFSAAWLSWGYRHGYNNGLNFYFIYYLAAGIFGLISFSLGLVSVFFTVKRIKFVFSVFGSSLLMAYGVFMLTPLYFFGLPILVFSTLSLSLVWLSKPEFN
jgi:hypothetical protein